MTKITSFSGDYAFLSNFYECPISIFGYTFTNAEAAFQSQKDLSRTAHFVGLEPGRAKKLGRGVNLRPDWEQVKDDIMRQVVLAKFVQNPSLADQLLDTGEAELIEGNYWKDYYWGICNGRGQNKLGKILMDIRDNALL